MDIVDKMMVEKHQKSLDILNKIFANPAFKHIHPLKQAFFLRRFNEHTAEIIKIIVPKKKHKRLN